MNNVIKSVIPVLLLFMSSYIAQAQTYTRYKGTTAAQFADSVLHYYNSVDSTEFSLAHPVIELGAGNPEMGKVILVLLHRNHHEPFAYLFMPVDHVQEDTRYVLISLDEFNKNSMTPVLVESVFTADADLDGDNELFIITSEGEGKKRTYSTMVFEQDGSVAGYLASFSRKYGVDLEGDSFTFEFNGLKTAVEVRTKLKADQKEHWLGR